MSNATMLRLMLLRHAKAEPAQPAMRDFDRALAPKGREAAPRIGAYMAAHALVPDLVLCSPARRARETWDLAASAFATMPRIIHEPRIYGLSAQGLLALAQATPPGVRVLLFVGHNPSLEELAALLIGAGEAFAQSELAEKFPTGALAAIDVSAAGWAGLAPRSGRLADFVTPRSLRNAPD